MKKCRTCNEEKVLSKEFFDKRPKNKDGWNNQCKVCSKTYSQKRYQSNRETILNRSKDYYNKNTDKKIQYQTDRYYNKQEELINYQTKYYQQNKVRERVSERRKERLQDDNMYKVISSARQVIRTAFKRKEWSKDSNTHNILGCDWITFKKHIESLFTDDMTWDNHNEWHYDHYYPLSQARNEKEMYMYNHYTNFQPLWIKDNLTKGAKVPKGHKEWREKITQLVDF
mgnify:CR=1 FL=1